MNINNIDLKISAGLPSQFLTDKPLVAFSGRSNVGKSTLINAVTNRKKLARTSASPGKTITINYFEVDRTFYLVDLPGYGFANRSKAEQEKWSALVQAFFDRPQPLRMLVQLIDLKVGPTADDRMMLEWLNGNAVPYMIVATKTDKLNTTDRTANLAALRKHELLPKAVEIYPFSGLDNRGRDDIQRRILGMFEPTGD